MSASSDTEDVEFSGEKSKSERKREFDRYHTLARRLVELSPKHFEEISLSDDLRDATKLARDLRKNALQRQLRFLTKLIAANDPDSVLQRLDALAHANDVNTRAFKELETWRDQLIDGDGHLLTTLLDRFPSADAQHLRQLIRNAHRERQQEKPPRSSRLLFRYLSAMRDGQ
jgi:ribosome-associated protein